MDFKDMYSKMIPTLLITMYSTYSTQCTVRLLYPIPLSVFEGSRIPSKFKEEFNSRLPNPHVISFNIQSLERGPPPPASCDVIKYALLQKLGVYPGPLKARALDNSRWKSARFCKNHQNLTIPAARAISCFSQQKARDQNMTKTMGSGFCSYSCLAEAIFKEAKFVIYDA